MLRILKAQVKNKLNLYQQRICRKEFIAQTFTKFNERPVEFGFVFRKLAQIYPQTVLDIGTGRTSLPHLMSNCGFVVTATDNIKDYWPSGVFNRHYYIINDDITDTRLDEQYDLITCISVLEHIEESDAAIRNMLNLLNPTGHLILTFPYHENGYIHNVYELPGSSYGQEFPFITQSYSRSELNRWLQDGQGVIVDQEYWEFWDGDYWTVGSQIIPPRKVGANDKHQLSCILIQRSI